MTTFWAYHNNDGRRPFIEVEQGRGRVLELHSTKEGAEKKCPVECVVKQITDSQLNGVFVEQLLYGVYLNGELIVWPDFKRKFLSRVDGD